MSEFLGRLTIGVSSGLIIGLLALGMVLIYKGSRIINFAHPFFGLLAAYFCWWITSKASFPPFSWLPFQLDTRPRFALGILFGLAIVALNGWGVEHGVIRRLRHAPRLVVVVATIALAQGTLGIVTLLFNRTDEQATVPKFLPVLINHSFQVGTRFVTGVDLQVLIAAAILGTAFALFFKFTRFGIAIRAAAENGDAAQLLGISARRVSVFTWVVGSALAGLAGILFTSGNQLNPNTLSNGLLLRALAAALIGGMTSLPGAIVGGLVVGIGESMLQWMSGNRPGVPEVGFFAMILAVLVFRPGGLFGQREETEDKVAFVPTMKDLPARLRATPAASLVRSAGYLMVVFLCSLSFFVSSTTNRTFSLIVIFGIVGVSLTILMGYTGQVSLGQWGLVGVGAFTAANLFTRMDVPYLLTFPLTFLVGMVVSLFIGLPALRIRGVYLAVVTLAFNVAAEFYIFRHEWIAGGSAGLQLRPPKLGPFDLDSATFRPMFWFCVLVLVFCLVLARNLARSRTGRGFFAVRENEKAATTMGVALTRYKLVAFAVAGGIAALAGALYASVQHTAEPTQWSTTTSLILVAMVMIGGLGSLSGSLFGAFVVFGLPRLLEFDNRWIVPISTGILLIVIIVRARGGVAGLVQRIREAMVAALHDLSQSQPPAATPPTATTPAGR